MAATAAHWVEDPSSSLDPGRLAFPWDSSQEPVAPAEGFIDILHAPPGKFFDYVQRLLVMGQVFRGRFTFSAIRPAITEGGRVVVLAPGIAVGMERHPLTPHPEAATIPSLLALSAATLRSSYAFVALNMDGGSFPDPRAIPPVLERTDSDHHAGLWEWYMFNREVVAHLIAAVRSHLPALGTLGARLAWEMLPHNLDATLGRALETGPFGCAGLPSTFTTPVVPLASIVIAWLYTLRLPSLGAPAWPRGASWPVPAQCRECDDPLVPGLLSCPRCDLEGRQHFVVPAYSCPTCSNISGLEVCPFPACHRTI